MNLLKQKQPKQTAIALACLGLFALAQSGVAKADVMASAVSTEQNFQILDTATNTILNAATDFQRLTYTSTGGYAGTYPGTSGYNASSSASPVDLPTVCVGSGCSGWSAAYGPNNSFTQMTKAQVGNYSAADQYENGAPIAGLTGLAPPATISSASYAGLTSDSGLSHSSATNNLNSNFIFQLAHAEGLTFNYSAVAYLQAFVSGTENFPSFATASYTQDFTLTDLTTGAVVWTFASDAFSNGLHTISLNAPFGVDVQTIESGTINYSVSTPSLNSTDLYQLSARDNVNADVQRVPEPGALVLLGIGLLGLLTVRARTHRA